MGIRMGPMGIHMDLYGSDRHPYGSVWSRMVPYGPVWFRMVPYGSVWFRMVPYGSV